MTANLIRQTTKSDFGKILKILNENIKDKSIIHINEKKNKTIVEQLSDNYQIFSRG